MVASDGFNVFGLSVIYNLSRFRNYLINVHSIDCHDMELLRFLENVLYQYDG